MNTVKTLILITGPTASGKTSLAIELAKKHGCDIVSADSRQVYRELNIGVARPTQEELNAAPHHLIAHRSIHEEYNTGLYVSEATNVLNQIWADHENAILCGGTGLYFKALLVGLDNLPTRNIILREELELIKNESGTTGLWNRLQKSNPQIAETIDKNNPQRLIRAIEISEAETSEAPKGQQNQFNYPFRILHYPILPEREVLYKRINLRVDKMIDEGLLNEAQGLIDFQHLSALKTVGYSELWPYFSGEVSLDFAIDKIKQHSRNYAKRQITWFKNQAIYKADSNFVHSYEVIQTS